MRLRALAILVLAGCGIAALAGCQSTFGAPPDDSYAPESNADAMENEEEEDALRDADL